MSDPRPSAPAASSGDMLAAASAAIAAGAPAAPGQPAPEAPAAPTAPSVESVVPSQPSEQQAEPEQPGGEAPKVHPAWEKVLEGIPEVFHEQIIAQANESSRRADEAIARARQQAAPEPWQQVIAAATEAGLSPNDLMEAYEGQAMLQEALLNDPDGLLEEINSTIDELVQSGQITRREGAERKAEAEEQLDEMLTDEQKIVRELQARLDKQDAERAAEEEARRAAELEAQQDAEARAFVDSFEAHMKQVGAFAVNEQGQLYSALPDTVVQQLSDAAADLVDDKGLSPQQAIAQAWADFTTTVTKFGGQIPTAQPAGQRPAPPAVIGGSAATPPAAPMPPTATSKDARENAMLAAIREMTSTQ